MNQPELATCQCIISHPSQPKFMAIKHKGGHLPPTVKIPQRFSIAENIGYILDGVQNKYGLRTVALRHLARFADYQCIELEIVGKDSRRLQAVWVGLEDYRRIHGAKRGGFDPLFDWLEEQERNVVPPERPPWEHSGWFKEAAHWIDFQLDRLNIQRTGSVVQKQAFLHASSVLRVPTSTGNLYFKASYDKAPREVPLTELLGEVWPDQVTEILAHDPTRNWMLMPDYGSGAHAANSVTSLCKAAEAMARIQLESAALLPRLHAAGCQPLGLEALRGFLTKTDSVQAGLALGESELSEKEREELFALLPRLTDICSRLAEYSLPELLIHPDFRAANFFPHGDSVRFIDWASSAVGQPFFSVLRLLRADRSDAFAALGDDPVVAAYLREFEIFETPVRLLEALELACQLQHAWELLLWSHELRYFEPRGVSRSMAQGFITWTIRQLLRAHSPSGAELSSNENGM